MAQCSTKPIGEALTQIRMAANLLGGASDILGEADQYDMRRYILGGLVDTLTALGDLWEDEHQPTASEGPTSASEAK